MSNNNQTIKVENKTSSEKKNYGRDGLLVSRQTGQLDQSALPKRQLLSGSICFCLTDFLLLSLLFFKSLHSRSLDKPASTQFPTSPSSPLFDGLSQNCGQLHREGQAHPHGIAEKCLVLFSTMFASRNYGCSLGADTPHLMKELHPNKPVINYRIVQV